MFTTLSKAFLNLSLRPRPTTLSYLPLPPPHPTLTAASRATFSTTPLHQWKGGQGNPKMKVRSHKGASKRFRISPEGQFTRLQAGHNHLMTPTPRRTRHLHKHQIIVHPTHQILLRKLLPYAGNRGAFRRLKEEELCWYQSGKFQRSGKAVGKAVERAREAELGVGGAVEGVQA